MVQLCNDSVADESSIYAFGSDYDGCLGCDGTEGDAVCTPKLIDFFSGIQVSQVSCGDAHVVALTDAGDVFTWGCGEFGKFASHDVMVTLLGNSCVTCRIFPVYLTPTHPPPHNTNNVELYPLETCFFYEI